MGAAITRTGTSCLRCGESDRHMSDPERVSCERSEYCASCLDAELGDLIREMRRYATELAILADRGAETITDIRSAQVQLILAALRLVTSA